MPLFGPFGALPLAAKTPDAGIALINNTQTLLTWTAPNDGQAHTVMLAASLSVTSTTTGGAIQVSYTAPDGTTTSHTVYPAGQTATDVIVQAADFSLVVKANTTVTFSQSSAMTAGAATFFGRLFAA